MVAYLSERKIENLLSKGSLVVHPLLSKSQISGTKIDLRIDNTFYLIGRIAMEAYDPAEFQKRGSAPNYLEKHVVPYGKSFVLHPGELILAPTFESLKIPNDLVGVLDGRSSLGRLGVLVHITAASVDPGFAGPLVSELLNIGRVPVDLFPLMRICSLSLATVEGKVSRAYAGKYRGLKNVESPGSALFKDPEWSKIVSFSGPKPQN